MGIHAAAPKLPQDPNDIELDTWYAIPGWGASNRAFLCIHNPDQEQVQMITRTVNNDAFHPGHPLVTITAAGDTTYMEEVFTPPFVKFTSGGAGTNLKIDLAIGMG